MDVRPAEAYEDGYQHTDWHGNRISRLRDKNIPVRRIMGEDLQLRCLAAIDREHVPEAPSSEHGWKHRREIGERDQPEPVPGYSFFPCHE